MLFVGVQFTLLTFIGAGAQNAFDKTLPYVAFASFFGTLLPRCLVAYFCHKEDLLNSKENIVNHGVQTAAVQVIAAIPYFAAAFVSSQRIAKILFWIPLALQSFSTNISIYLFKFIHRRPENKNRTEQLSLYTSTL